MRRALALLMIAGFLGAAGPAAAAGPRRGPVLVLLRGHEPRGHRGAHQAVQRVAVQVQDRGHLPGRLLRGPGQDPRRGGDQDRARRVPRDRRGHPAARRLRALREPRALRQGPERRQPRGLPARADPAHLLRLPGQAAGAARGAALLPLDAHPLLQRRHARGQGREGAGHVGRAAGRGGQAHRARGQRDQDVRLRGAGGLVVLVRAAPRGGRLACSRPTARRPPSATRARRRSSSGWTS